MKTRHPGLTLRALMDRGTVPAPGAFNALVARQIARAGFEACYVSGGATSVAAGVPDVGLLTLDHFARTVREVVLGSGLPVLADADTGFGEEEMVRRTVIEYNHAGAAGLHIEDQVFPKRCGHLEGKTLIPLEQAVGRIEWASRAARDCSEGAFLICARTDARGVEGFDAALDRAEAYIEAGAAMIFPEGL
ncbi:MAG TPA: methylisocitrate lyase, partial [Phycisphaerales bacterium]|nr:methylisocitrate lyase [Phycisphaerales bacterium]